MVYFGAILGGMMVEEVARRWGRIRIVGLGKDRRVTMSLGG